MPAPEMKPTENQGEVASDWVNAPGDSHVARFRLLDRTASEFGAGSQIIVVFKAATGKTHRPEAAYAYKFSVHDQARAVFDALCGAAHPGEVVDAQLKKARVPYERVS